MWNTLKQVAEDRRLPVEEFIKFGIENKERYGIDFNKFGGTQEIPMVNTWHVDDLIYAFKQKNK